ncbi:hypothetical protein [Nocardia vulneris]|uniref:hypothetical protein n=1 Tax=Nocardia vulneris TaxID=1141657 RepID=UPI000B33B070|nr:hypothetical protein [Nocardia vulneris]
MTIPVGPEANPLDLAAVCFAALVDEFYFEDGRPRPFFLRPKRGTQDDPFDELISNRLDARLPSKVKVLASGKPLVSPDMVIARPEEASLLINGGQELDDRRMIAIEVKKVDTTKAGKIGRATGMDFNSTPPCSHVRIYAKNGAPLLVPAFYLFAAHTPHEEDRVIVGLALVSGAALNQDKKLYDLITGIRDKAIDLGTFGDGLDRQRPMMVFSNPLGWDWMKAQPTLIHHRKDLADEQDHLHRIRRVLRTAQDGGEHEFWAYRRTAEKDEGVAIDPFPTPDARSTKTTQRGKFIVDL